VRLLWLVLVLLIPSWSFARPSPELPRARITIQAVPEGLQADFVLSKPTNRFEFARADIARDDNFRITSRGQQFANGAVTSSKAFRRFSLLVRHTEQNYDGQYAALRPIGEGRVLQAFALHGSPS
jgi:hypothetical protein